MLNTAFDRFRLYDLLKSRTKNTIKLILRELLYHLRVS
jgi:hypothetical protein